MRYRRVSLSLLLAVLLAPSLALLTLPPAAPVAAAEGFATDAFRRTWTRTDRPVEDLSVKRSWLWGPQPLNTLTEPYANAPGGQRRVQYFDKSRMEINDPARNFVTNGLLATELILGRVQNGDNFEGGQFEARQPAGINIAGDEDDTEGPTYATLSGLYRGAPLDEGAPITETIDRGGNVGTDPDKARFNVRAVQLIPESNQRIASVFWDFFNLTGPVQNDGGRANEKIFEPWYAAGGFPVTRAYWTRAKVAGQVKDVLLQCFERRCLTYTPDNPEGFRVEMGNIGRHYYKWRYGGDPSPAGPSTPQPDDLYSPGPGIGFGFNGFYAWAPDQANLERSMDVTREAGTPWVRQQIIWRNVEPNPGEIREDVLAKYDAIVREAARRDMRIMFSVTKAPQWASPNSCHSDGTCGLPDDPQTFARFMTFLANRWKATPDTPTNRITVAAYEIWNEQNTAGETGGNVRVGPYVETLKAAYNALKAVDRRLVVVYGGLTPTGTNRPNLAIDDVIYLEQSYQYNGGEVRNYFDVLGAHPGSNNNPPDALWPEQPGPGTGCPEADGKCWQQHPSFYFRRIEGLRAVMEKYGDAKKKMWLTEFGWTTQNAAPGYGYGSVISEETQAQYLVRALQKGCNEYGWVGVMFIWTLNHSVVTPPTDEKYPWSVLNGDWSPRPSYNAIKAMNKERNKC